MFRIHINHMYRLHNYISSHRTLLATSNMLITDPPSFALVALWSFLPQTRTLLRDISNPQSPNSTYCVLLTQSSFQLLVSRVATLTPLVHLHFSTLSSSSEQVFLLPLARKLPLSCPEVLAVADMQQPHLTGETLAANGS